VYRQAHRRARVLLMQPDLSFKICAHSSFPVPCVRVGDPTGNGQVDVADLAAGRVEAQGPRVTSGNPYPNGRCQSRWRSGWIRRQHLERPRVYIVGGSSKLPEPAPCGAVRLYLDCWSRSLCQEFLAY
jgi:hypothetical protein